MKPNENLNSDVLVNVHVKVHIYVHVHVHVKMYKSKNVKKVHNGQCKYVKV